MKLHRSENGLMRGLLKIKRMKKTVLIILSFLLLLSGCYYDNEETLYPGSGNCEQVEVKFSVHVWPVLQANGCVNCHSGQAPSGNISLENYSAVKIQALNGKLYGSISHSSGFSPMPKGGNKMTTCNISRIKAWIDAGALNN